MSDLPKEPTPGEHHWLTHAEMFERWPNIAKDADSFVPSCLWCGHMQQRRGNKHCRGRVGLSLRARIEVQP